jgi:hypothetical protein
MGCILDGGTGKKLVRNQERKLSLGEGGVGRRMLVKCVLKKSDAKNEVESSG